MFGITLMLIKLQARSILINKVNKLLKFIYYNAFFALAWWLDSSQAYHAIMSIILIPGWILSGAMFPINHDNVTLSWIMSCNPMSYIVDGVRRSFYDELPLGTTVSNSLLTDLLVVIGFTLFSLVWANVIVTRSK